MLYKNDIAFSETIGHASKAEINGSKAIRAKVARRDRAPCIPVPSGDAGLLPSCRCIPGLGHSAGCTAGRRRAGYMPGREWCSSPSWPCGQDVADHISSTRTRTRATDPRRQ